MGRLGKSMLKGSKYIVRKVLPVLASGYGPAGTAAGAAASQAMNKPDAPDVPDPIPLPDEEALLRARRRRTRRSSRELNSYTGTDDQGTFGG